MAPEATITITTAPTRAGLNEARRLIDELEHTLFKPQAVASSSSEPDADAVKLYKRTKPGTRSRELLETLPGGQANALLPTELGLQMKPDTDGNPLSKGSVRGAIRVVQRVTAALAKSGSIGGDVLQIDFAAYDLEGAGRYFMDEAARQALDDYLARQRS